MRKQEKTVPKQYLKKVAHEILTGETIAEYVRDALCERYFAAIDLEAFPHTPEVSLELDRIEEALRIIDQKEAPLLAAAFDTKSTTLRFQDRYVQISHP
jgi:hypothetical protein